jgi:hypothetical protein
MPEPGETGLGSLGFRVESLGDFTDLGLHTSVDNNDSCSTFGDLRTGKGEADTVTRLMSFDAETCWRLTYPTGQSSSSIGSSCLATGKDSPVRKASSHSRLLQCPSMIRPSAGTISPFFN